MKRVDFILLFSVLALTLFGLFMIYNASSVIALRDFNDPYHYIKRQSINAVIGIAGLLFFTYFNYKRLYNLAFFILLLLHPGLHLVEGYAFRADYFGWRGRF